MKKYDVLLRGIKWDVEHSIETIAALADLPDDLEYTIYESDTWVAVDEAIERATEKYGYSILDVTAVAGPSSSSECVKKAAQKTADQEQQ